MCKEVRSHYSHSYNKKRANKWKITDSAQIVFACNAGDRGSIPGSGRSTGEGIGYSPQYSWASLVAQLVKESSYNMGDLGSIPGLGRSPGGGHGNPLQYSCLEDPMDRGAWWSTVHWVAKN